MKGNVTTMNMLAMLADADARQTASLVELIASVALLNLKPPSFVGQTVTLKISQADVERIGKYYVETSYDDTGMTIHVTSTDD